VKTLLVVYCLLVVKSLRVVEPLLVVKSLRVVHSSLCHPQHRAGGRGKSPGRAQ
jgi:hypothetical protein